MLAKNEGHFCHLFFLMRQCICDYYASFSQYAVKGTTLYWISEEEITEEFKNFVLAFMKERYGEKPWVEKTANIESLNSALCYQDVWPDARFVFARRRPIEIILSRVRKFPTHDFEYHVKDIKQVFSTWSLIKNQIKTKVEIDQYDIVVSPEETAQKLTSILDTLTESGPRITDVLRNTFPQRTSENYQPAIFDDLDWSGDMRSYFVDVLDDIMKEYGYSYGPSYWL